MSKSWILLLVLVCAFYANGQTAGEPQITQGSLFAYGKGGKELGNCPLTSTKVTTDISGFLARVRVTQEFENSFVTPIEAVYTFPLSQNGAVDDMTMTVGQRVIRGKIMKREEARAVYNAAKNEGQTASLLDQERPNIFTQSVANIMPGDKVTIEISYVETLKYEDGAYEFVFPMTVAPRYIPAGSGTEDSAKISPPAADMRSGHDISISVDLNAGVPIDQLRSNTHDISVNDLSPGIANVLLKSETTIPNKDFVLRYDVIGAKLSDSVLATRSGAGNGFFSLILSPPEKIAVSDVAPKEIVFVLDTSGSMSGFPIEKAKEAMKLAIDGLYPNDTFNLITFAGDTRVLFDQPVPATQENIEIAQKLLDSEEGEGGTEMMDAIRAALAPSDALDHIRIVCFMTDGEVGNDREIIAEVKKHPNARVFSFGIGESVNRFLLDNIAKEGRGEAQYIMLEDDGSAAAKQFHERIRNPYLTDISIDWNGLPITGVYPQRIPDLFGAKPIMVYGRYTAAASGNIRLRGKIGGQPFERTIAVNLPASEENNSVLASLWARTKIDELMSASWDPEDEQSKPTAITRTQVTKLGLEYNLMTQYTSFVAVEERIVNQTRNGRTVRVPVYAPAGTVFEGDQLGGSGSGTGSGGGYGQGAAMANAPASVGNLTLTTSSGSGGGTSAGYGTGSGNGTGSGSGTASAAVNVSGGGGGGGGGRALQTSNATVGNTISTRRIQSLPANGLRSQSLLTLSPGVTSSNKQRVISSGVLNGRANALPKPVYPAAAISVHASGSVQISVTIDEKGNVISATPVSGHPLLRAAATRAAQSAKFSPTMLSGKPVTVTGFVTYNFVTSSKVKTVGVRLGNFSPISEAGPERIKLSPDEARSANLKHIAHWWVYSIIDRLAKGVSAPSARESQFVTDGEATLQVELSSFDNDVRQKLSAAGFEFLTSKGTKLTGRIAIEKLAALADIEEVKLILPLIN